MNTGAHSMDPTPDRSQSGLVVRLAQRGYAILTAPVRAFLAIRGAMTPASVSVLLFAIVTLNIIWGFPWLGLFSACVGIFVAGCLIHFITRPSLDTQFSLPNSAPQGQPFQVTIHAENRGLLPALDFGFEFSQPALPRRRWYARRRKLQPDYSLHQNPQRNLFLSVGDSATHTAMLTYHRRGIRKLPSTIISGSFPFHLFASSVEHPSTILMPITPSPLTGDNEHAKDLLNSLGGWSHKLLSGDQLDYTGSREYEPGMPVRRWDFPSWARLGTPIVREFQSPSIQNVYLIVDTALPEHMNLTPDGLYPAFEQMLSLATTAIHDLAKQTVKLQLFVTEAGDTNESPNSNTEKTTAFLSDTDAESLLIKLAAAEPIPPKAANQQISNAMEFAGRSPILLLTTRDLTDLHSNSPESVTVMRTDVPQDSQVTQTRPGWRIPVISATKPV